MKTRTDGRVKIFPGGVSDDSLFHGVHHKTAGGSAQLGEAPKEKNSYSNTGRKFEIFLSGVVSRWRDATFIDFR